MRLRGDFRIADAEAVWRELTAAERRVGRRRVVVDLSGVREMDGAVVALVMGFRSDLAGVGAEVEFTGARKGVAELFHLYGGDQPARRPDREAHESWVTRVGRGGYRVRDEIREVVAFVGEIALGAVQVWKRPRAGNWRHTIRIFERAGADAVPIVVLLDFLIGFVMGFQAARQLRIYGANVYSADLVGLSVTRELAPLLTAVIVTGRSGAAFAAEIGTMKVADEIDALRTMGFSPIPYLVFPRVLGLLAVTPILTLFGDVVGCLGGMVVASTSLDVSPMAYYSELVSVVKPFDVVSGLFKAAAFALAIGTIGCQQGFATSGGAEGVGRRTTTTVVASLFALVILDTLLTVLFRRFGA